MSNLASAPATCLETPASFAQSRLWFLDQLDPGSAAHNLPGGSITRGAAPPAALVQALNETIRRHEALRTQFAYRDDDLVQVIASSAHVTPIAADLRGLRAEDAAAEARRLRRREGQRGFDLSVAPLLRLALVTSRESRRESLTVHHILCDAHGLDVVRREARGLARAYASGVPRSLPEPAAQYRAFVSWQRAWVESEEGRAHLAYWIDHLAPPRAVLDLPVDRPKPAVTLRGGRFARQLSRDTIAGLKRLGTAENASLFIVLLTALKGLLSRCMAETDVVVGSPIANRTAAFADVVGLMVNTVVLRTDLSGSPTFTEALRRVRRTCLAAYAHQQVPFELVVEHLHPERSAGRTPLIDVWFDLHHETAGRAGVGAATEAGGNEREIAKFDLVLEAVESARDVWISWIYATDLFNRATVERLADQFEAFVAAAVADPDRRLAEVSLWAPVERADAERVLTLATGLPQPESIVRMMEHHAAHGHDAVSLADGYGQHTAGALNGRANRLARHLRRAGVGPEVRVGVLVDRSATWGVALLAILKAGAVYVPLSGDLPPDRLEWMFDDAGIGIVVTEQAMLHSLPPSALGCDLVWMDSDWPAISDEGSGNLLRDPLAAGLAYLIYTSGSTGQPKGVGVTYAATAEHARAAELAFELVGGDRVFQFAALSFDVSLEQMLAPLSAGAAVWVRGRELASALELTSQLRREQITVANLPTAYWASLATDPVACVPLAGSALRLMIAGGERLPRAAATAWTAALSGCRLINAYGPTEGVITATTAIVRPGGSGEVPIGIALAGRKVWLDDGEGGVCPTGVLGEICLGGRLLARGYWNRPGKTAGAFVPDRYSWTPGDRCYPTGDLGRWRPAGFEYAGRRDGQVKLRGYRIELQEVEAALERCAGIRQSVAALQPGPQGAPMLVAYVVANGDSPFDERRTRSQLEAWLPEYAVPQAFVTIARLPLTPNGKIDRRSLPAPSRSPAAAARRAPETPAERILAQVWRDVLRVQDVTVDDDFFDLGGDSILSLQIVARAARENLRITPQQVFETPTIAGLAAAATVAPLAEEAISEGPAPLTPTQQWFFDQQFTAPQHWNMAVVLRVPPIPPADVERAVRAVFAHHEALRLRFEQTEHGWQQSSEPEGPPLEVHDLRAAGGAWHQQFEEQAQRVQRSLDLASRLVVTVLFRLPPDIGNRLLVVAHHLVVDAVSWRILAEDIETACAQATDGRVELPAQTASWRTWARGLSARAADGIADGETDYWRTVASVAATIRVPLDSPDGANTVESTAKVVRRLNADATRALQDASRLHRAHVVELLLAGVAWSLQQWTGNPRVALTVEGHGREPLWDVDVSRTVGWFTTLYPMVLEVGDPPTTLRLVKDALRAVPQRGIGYGLLRYFSPDAATRQALDASLPSVCVNYLGQFEEGAATRGQPRVAPAAVPRGDTRDPRQRRPFMLDVTMSITGGTLLTAWSYSSALHRRERIEQLADDHLVALAEMIGAGDAGLAQLSVADFPLVALEQAAFDRLILGVAAPNPVAE